MKIEKLTVRKNGKVFTGDVVWPTGIHQAIHLLGELEVWEAFRIGYLELAKKRISGAIRPRKKWVKLDVSTLDEHARAWVFSHIENQRRAEEAAKNQKAAVQQTFQSDYDETQEEASGADQLSENGGQPAQEPPKYSDALDSSTQQQTETAFEPLGLEEDLHRGTRLA